MCISLNQLLKITVFLSILCTAGAGDDQDKWLYDRVFDDLMAVGTGNVLQVPVKDYHFNISDGNFLLREGDLYLLSPVNNRRVAAVFTGKGSFRFAPPVEVERQQLNRFFEMDTLAESFEFLFLMFSDSLSLNLEKLAFTSAKEGTDLSKQVADVFDYLSARDDRYFRTDLLKFLLDEDAPEYYYAHFYETSGKPLMFEFNPYEKESVRLMQRAELGHLYKIPEVVCQYPPDGNYNLPEKRLFRIEKFDIESVIDPDLTFHGKASISLVIERDSQKWLPFNIYHGMIIDSVITADGNSLKYFKPRDVLVFWIENNKKMTATERLDLTVYYHCEDLIVRDERSWIIIRSPNYWYPRNTLWVPSEFQLTFHYPAGMSLISIGDQVEIKQSGDIMTAFWQPAKPVTHASFNLGYFETYIDSSAGLAKTTIMKTKHGLLFRSREIEKEIAEDITGSIAFFAKVFGKPVFKHLYVSEVPFGHGLAFSGLLNLSWSTFYSTEKEGYDNLFRAHEVAHQWWGIEVRFDSYHDQWLSESFCEYAAIWYLQQQPGGEDQVEDIFEDWYDLIMKSRSYLLASDQEGGPVWLGSRTSSSRSAGDYSLIVYKKGAWVLHMLRMMLHDWQTGSDQRFIELMQDFYISSAGREVTTADFQKIVEKHCRQDMEWFFRNWIYGTELPSYKYAIDVNETPGNEYNVHIRIAQDGEHPLFKMPVPIEFVYNDGSRNVTTIRVDGRKAELTLTLKQEPDEININPNHALLAEIEEVSWDDL